jgi:hypothetical protein
MGHRYRLHKTTIPGKAVLTFASRRKIIFVHGCFWHRHDARPRDSLLARFHSGTWVSALRFATCDVTQTPSLCYRANEARAAERRLLL